jgi:hypothetical protein
MNADKPIHTGVFRWGAAGCAREISGLSVQLMFDFLNFCRYFQWQTCGTHTLSMDSRFRGNDTPGARLCAPTESVSICVNLRNLRIPGLASFCSCNSCNSWCKFFWLRLRRAAPSSEKKDKKLWNRRERRGTRGKKESMDARPCAPTKRISNGHTFVVWPWAILELSLLICVNLRNLPTNRLEPFYVC